MITTVVVAYLALLVLLLLAELGVPGLSWLRATNQVLILLALLFLPFVFLAGSQVVRSVSLKISGQELHLELVELRDNVDSGFRDMETRFAGQVSTAEQALWPILAGPDPTCEQRWRGKELIIGSKLDASQAFFAHLLAVWLERAGLHCTPRVPNGGSLKNFADLKNHWIDLYIDYTGTCCQYFNIDHRHSTQPQIVDELNSFGRGIGVRWLPRLGASENYCLVVRKELAAAEGLVAISDLTRVAGRLVFTADPEFLNRRDCYIGLRTAYALAFDRVEPCRVTDRYAMLESGEADVFVGYETDPELSPALQVLEDADGFFPEYHALPVVSAGALDRIEGLEHALELLAGIMTTADLTWAVQRLRLAGQDPERVAQDFLREKQASLSGAAAARAVPARSGDRPRA